MPESDFDIAEFIRQNQPREPRYSPLDIAAGLIFPPAFAFRRQNQMAEKREQDIVFKMKVQDALDKQKNKKEKQRIQEAVDTILKMKPSSGRLGGPQPTQGPLESNPSALPAEMAGLGDVGFERAPEISPEEGMLQIASLLGKPELAINALSKQFGTQTPKAPKPFGGTITIQDPQGNPIEVQGVVDDQGNMSWQTVGKPVAKEPTTLNPLYVIENADKFKPETVQEAKDYLRKQTYLAPPPPEAIRQIERVGPAGAETGVYTDSQLREMAAQGKGIPKPETGKRGGAISLESNIKEKTINMKTAIDALDRAMKAIQDPKTGKIPAVFNRTLFEASVGERGIPFTKGRTAKSDFMTSLTLMRYTLSGKNVTAAEKFDLETSFIPMYGDLSELLELKGSKTKRYLETSKAAYEQLTNNRALKPETAGELASLLGISVDDLQVPIQSGNSGLKAKYGLE
jgi:hypothetical protein